MIRDRSSPEIPIKGAILNGLQHMTRLNLGCTFEVGEGAGDFKDAIEGAGAEMEVAHGLVKIGIAFIVELTVLPELTGLH